ncbi:hypothetical protein NDN08_005522 [Rhodosorus marinus]|uniref:3-isopropylmalate dehydrogenase n=1 Tax=Rhodosorus marinus TaxID=101924 RepID=A0AAV8V3Y6_9RHOD|nr:hypothetical protein NDN08_005522 [Rhodosorus marinus]
MAFVVGGCRSGLGARTSARQATATRRSVILMATSKKDKYSITTLPGDGIGPEIISVTTDILKEVGKRHDFSMDFTECPFGGAGLDAAGEPLPAETLASCKSADSILLAAIGGPKWDGLPREKRPETGLLGLRKGLGLYANLRPAKSIKQLLDASSLKREVVEGVDIMVVRELTGDVYFGEPKGIETKNGQRVGYNNMIYHEHEVTRIGKIAYDISMKRTKKLCSVDKANVLDVSQLWRDVITTMNSDYPDVELSHMYVDNAAMQLVRWPKQFDTIVTGNIFGDILSDEASMLVGSLGMLPSASLGDPSGPGMYEPIHGSAPDIAGQDKANPIATVLSAAMMLKYDLDQPEAADAMEEAVNKTLDAGFRTGDIMSDDCTQVGCKEMGEKLLSFL